MKHLMTALTLALAAFVTTSHAANTEASAASAPMGKQQSKMATCNADAADKKGDERKAFMKTCLSNKPATQQSKMTTCNADPKAKTLKGDERKAFMKECLSAK